MSRSERRLDEPALPPLEPKARVMRTAAITPADLSRSVIAVPPLARRADLTVDRGANAALIRSMEAGGITTIMYGGNANFFHVGVGEYAATIDGVAESAGAQTWLIPSVGPDFGKMMDQLAILRERAFPTAMMLPSGGPMSPSGAVKGITRAAERYGKPLILYIKSETFLAPAELKRLIEAGVVISLKYGIARNEPSEDAFLARLTDAVDPSLVVSGSGERPALAHMRDFGLAGFTSGLACLAPRAAQSLLEALKRRDFVTAERLRARFLPLEDCRDALGLIPVLHDAVSLSRIADMGTLLPLLDNLDPAHHDRVRRLVRDLLAFERSLAEKAA